MTEAVNGLPIVDGLRLSAEHRELLRPGELMHTRNGHAHRLPRFFYAVESSDVAVKTLLTPHFGLWELTEVDLYEAPLLRKYPRYVPCAVTVLAAALEVLRTEIGAPVRVSANGGYRSPAHALSKSGSPHCWGTAANVFRIGSDYLDSEEKIQRYAAVVNKTIAGCWTRPYGYDTGFADDHLHGDAARADRNREQSGRRRGRVVWALSRSFTR
jgi:hypothetical protein